MIFCKRVKAKNLKQVVGIFKNLKFKRLSHRLFLLKLVVNSAWYLWTRENRISQEMNMALREMLGSRWPKLGGKLRHARTSKI